MTWWNFSKSLCGVRYSTFGSSTGRRRRARCRRAGAAAATRAQSAGARSADSRRRWSSSEADWAWPPDQSASSRRQTAAPTGQHTPQTSQLRPEHADSSGGTSGTNRHERVRCGCCDL